MRRMGKGSARRAGGWGNAVACAGQLPVMALTRKANTSRQVLHAAGSVPGLEAFGVDELRAEWIFGAFALVAAASVELLLGLLQAGLQSPCLTSSLLPILPLVSAIKFAGLLGLGQGLLPICFIVAHAL